MNLTDLLDIGAQARELTDDEWTALRELVEATPISITPAEAKLMKRGVELFLGTADPLATGVAPLDTEIDTAQANFSSLATTVEIGVTVLIDLVDWPTGQPQTTQIEVTDATDLDEIFPGGWSHLLWSEALFEDGLPTVWAPHEADPTEIQALVGDSKWLVWEGTIAFNEDGTEAVYSETGDFRSPNLLDLRLFKFLR
jgi:hypothetical protein